MKIYIDVFVLGVSLAWGACLCFCAPILFSYIAGTQNNWLKGLKLSLAFSLARIISYVILSLISAGLGYYIIRRFYETPAKLIIYIAAGALVALLGMFIVTGRQMSNTLTGTSKSGNYNVACRFIGKFCQPGKNPDTKGLPEMILLGLLIGFAPCAPLLGLLIYIAFNAQNFLHGALLGFTFGLGTLLSPLILFAPLAGKAAGLLQTRPLVYKIFSRLCGLILVYLGAGMIFSAWGVF